MSREKVPTRLIAVAGSRRLGTSFDAAVQREWARGHVAYAVGGRSLGGDIAGDHSAFGEHARRVLERSDELLVVRRGEVPGQTVESEIVLAEVLGVPVRVEEPPEE